jgi:hypothetical protein
MGLFGTDTVNDFVYMFFRWWYGAAICGVVENVFFLLFID